MLALVLVAAALYWQIRSTSRTIDRIQASDAAISQTNLVGRLIVDEESGLRGYEATGDERFLEPYNNAIASLPGAFDRLEALPLNNSEKEKIAHLRTDHLTWFETFAQPIFGITHAGGEELIGAHDISLNLQGKQRMDTVRGDLQALVEASEAHRVDRVERWRKQVRHMIGGLIAFAIIVGIFIGLFTRNRLHVVSRAYQTSLDLLRLKSEEVFLSEQRLRTTLASIGDGVITCDFEGRVRSMNQVAADLTGWSAEEALDRPLPTVFRIVNETSREPSEDPVAKVKRLNKIVGLANHTVLIRKDGTELNIADSGAPIRDQGNAITGIVLVFRDVTLEKQTQAALIASEKLAVAGRLAASIAHEIHNPLDSVSNMLYLMRAGSTPEETSQFLEMAQQELSRVTQISRSMLSLYRESTAPVPINIKEMLEGTVVLLSHRLHDLHTALSLEVPDGLAVSGFPAELRQVFTNLVVNAVEAAGAEGRIEIVARHLAPGTKPSGERQEDGVVIEVTDNGAGIDDEACARLFQPFFSTKGEQGTGLGLWVSRGIVNKHGGSIELHSRKDTHGAVARVFLATRPVISPGAD